MIRTIARTISFTIIAAMALAATTALAQETRVTGTVSRVDTTTRTIYFADGSAVRLQPGAVIMTNGQQIPLESLVPGASTTVVSTAPSAGTVATPATHPAGDVIGTVAQVDRQTGTVTLQDGRRVMLNNQSTVWQAMSIDSIQPGTQIYVHNAQPVATTVPAQPLATAVPQTYDPNVQIGTVKYVDQGAKLIALNDGTFAKVLPSTRLESGGRPLALGDVRPGDQVAIRPLGHTEAATTGPSRTAGLGTASATVSRGDGSPVSAVQADAIEVRRPVR